MEQVFDKNQVRLLEAHISLPHEDEGLLINYGWIRQLLTSAHHPSEQARNYSRLFRDHTIDVELLKSWLEICKEQHNSMYPEDRTFYASFAFETRQICIAPLLRLLSHVALRC